MIIGIYHIAGMGEIEYVRNGPGSVVALRASLYCQFRFEELYPQAPMPLCNRDISMILTDLYSFEHSEAPLPDTPCYWIEMHDAREASCGDPYRALMLDTSLYRDGLDEFLQCCRKRQDEFIASVDFKIQVS